MASGTTVSRALGFVKAVLLVEAIGQTQSISADAFANGNFLPNTLYMVLLGGMLNAVLVPQIVRASHGADGGAGYINKVLTLVSVLLFSITALAMLFAPWIVQLYAVSWPDDQLALATAFAYWCLPQIIFYGLFTVLGEVLNARQVFGPFTWAPALNNVVGSLGILAFILMFGADPNGERTTADWSEGSIALLAGSATLGVAAQALILFVSWKKAGISFRPDFAWRGMGIGRTARIASWSLGMIVVINLGGIVTTNVANSASGVGPSSLALQNAWLMFMLPHSILAVSIGTAYFTRLAEAGHENETGEFRRMFSAPARQVSLLMIYASAAMFAAAPFLSRVMQPSADQVLVDQFSLVLRAYMLGLAAYSLLFIVQRAFYALSDTRTPFFFTLGQIVVFSLGSLVCLMLPAGIRGAGVALMFSLSTILQLVVATLLLRRKIRSIDGHRIVQSLVKSLVAGLIAGGILTFAVTILLRALDSFGFLAAIGLAAVVAILVGIIYVVILAVMRSNELRDVTSWARARLGRNGDATAE